MADNETFLDLFSGVGGLTLGLQRSGLRPVLAVDHWDDAVRTYRTNFAHKIISASIEDFDSRQLRQLVPDRPDWIVGGPPCQGFSTVGKRNRNDPRNKLFLEFHRIVKTLRPEGFLIENVLGLKDMSFESDVVEVFSKLGYKVEFRVLCAADYGVPQLRRRVVFVGHRNYGRFKFPPPQLKPKEYVTVWDAIGDLPILNSGESADSYSAPPSTSFQRKMRGRTTKLTSHVASSHPDHLIRAISFISDGGNRSEIPDHYQPSSGFHNSYSRLNSKAPAVAVTQNMGKPSGTRCIHPFQNRGLTAREGARLQSFPDSFQFSAGITSQRLQIANAVPPLLAEALGRALHDPKCWL